MFWYSLGEACFGLEFMAGTVSMEVISSTFPSWLTRIIRGMIGNSTQVVNGIPFAGPILGVLTAITAPLLWPIAFELCWSKELKDLFLRDSFWPIELYNTIIVPVAIPIGFVAGLSMHTILKPFITGSNGVPWHFRSLPLTIALGAAAAVYFGYCNSPVEDLLWVKRIHPLDGRELSFNVRTEKVEFGSINHFSAFAKRSVISYLQFFRNPLKAILATDSITVDEKDIIRRSKRKLCFDDVKITADLVDDYSELLFIIDKLLRLKYIHMVLKKDSNFKSRVEIHGENIFDDDQLVDIENLRKEAVELDASFKNFGIKSLTKLCGQVETAVVISRLLKRSRDLAINREESDDGPNLLLSNKDQVKVEKRESELRDALARVRKEMVILTSPSFLTGQTEKERCRFSKIYIPPINDSICFNIYILYCIVCMYVYVCIIFINYFIPSHNLPSVHYSDFIGNS